MKIMIAALGLLVSSLAFADTTVVDKATLIGTHAGQDQLGKPCTAEVATSWDGSLDFRVTGDPGITLETNGVTIQEIQGSIGLQALFQKANGQEPSPDRQDATIYRHAGIADRIFHSFPSQQTLSISLYKGTLDTVWIENESVSGAYITARQQVMCFVK